MTTRPAAPTGPQDTGGAPDRVHRRVGHVMGMPISLAMRGCHAGDRYGESAWARALSVLHQADRVFSTYRGDSFVSRLGCGEVGVADYPADVAEVLALAELARVQSDGAFDVHLVGPDGRAVLDLSGVVKGWAVQRASRRSRTGRTRCAGWGLDPTGAGSWSGPTERSTPTTRQPDQPVDPA